jgi:hypothetical protein
MSFGNTYVSKSFWKIIKIRSILITFIILLLLSFGSSSLFFSKMLWYNINLIFYLSYSENSPEFFSKNHERLWLFTAC